MEIIIGHWTEEFFEMALWKSKRKGEKKGDGKFPVYILKKELDAHYISVTLDKIKGPIK